MLVEFAREAGRARRLRRRAPPGGQGRPGDVAPRAARRVGLGAGRPGRRGRARAGPRTTASRPMPWTRSRRRRSRHSASSRPTSSSPARWSSIKTRPGRSSASLRQLARPDGLLVVTTPNAYRLLNSRRSAASSSSTRTTRPGTPAHPGDPARPERVRSRARTTRTRRREWRVGTPVRGARAAFVSVGRLASVLERRDRPLGPPGPEIKPG